MINEFGTLARSQFRKARLIACQWSAHLVMYVLIMELAYRIVELQLTIE